MISSLAAEALTPVEVHRRLLVQRVDQVIVAIVGLGCGPLVLVCMGDMLRPCQVTVTVALRAHQ